MTGPMGDRTRLRSRPTIRHPRLGAGRSPLGSIRGTHPGFPDESRAKTGRYTPLSGYTPLSLLFRRPAEDPQLPAPSSTLQVDNRTTVNLSPRFTFLLHGRDHFGSVVTRADRQFRSAAPSAESTDWAAASTQHHRNAVEVASTLTSLHRSRTNEVFDIRDISRVERVYRSKLINTAATTTPTPIAPGVLRPPTAAKAVDMDQLDTELWKRFEKRIRVERERRGRA